MNCVYQEKNKELQKIVSQHHKATVPEPACAERSLGYTASAGMHLVWETWNTGH